jgi:hypothetical protein
MPTTRANLDVQTDLKQPSVPVVGDDVVNKDYVDSVAGGPLATSAPGGGVVGRSTFDENLGLEILPGTRAGVKLDGTSVQFNGFGEIEALAAAVPDATSGAGGGVVGKSTYDSNKGLLIGAGAVAEVKVDGLCVQFNGGGQLTVPNGTAASGGAVKGKVTLDSDQGLDATLGVARVKVDLATIAFNLSGELEVVGGGGGTVGSVSYEVPFTRNIPAVAPVLAVTIGSNISAARYEKAAGTTGERFEFTVGDDYFAGNLEVLVCYRMTTAIASPNNQIRVSTQAEIVDPVTGLLDTASYPETQANFIVPDNSLIFVRQTILTVADGDFNRGSDFSVAIKRFAGSGSDLHSGDWEVVAYEFRYTAILDSRIAVQVADFFSDAVTETTAVPVTLGTIVDAINFPTGADAGAKFTFIVPDNWDFMADALVYLTFAMSSAAVGNVRINTYGEIVDVVTGTITVLPSVDFDFSPPVSTNPAQRLVRTIPLALLTKGSYVTLVMARRVAIGGNHTGDFYLTAARAAFTTAPVSGFTSVLVTESYLDDPVYGNVVGSVTTDRDYPSFAGDFEAVFSAASTSAAGRVDASFQGRLALAQATVATTKIGFKLGAGASPEYRLKIYAEGSGAVAVYDSGLTAAPGAYTEVTVSAVMMSAQPTGLKRFFIVVEAYIDAGETLLFSRPFVRQE